jgi:uncharacterized protein (DUF1684 family)
MGRSKVVLCVAGLAFAQAANRTSDIEKWRADRETRLKAPDGWLSLAGLFWLREGENPIGSASESRVQLPAGFPAKAGTLVLSGRSVALRPDPSAGIQVNGKPATGGALKTDRAGSPDVITIGRLKLGVIERGSKIGVRMRDPQSVYRSGFKGLKWYPPDARWIIKGRFVPQPKKLYFDATAGDRQEMTSPGYVEWSAEGRTVRLTPAEEDGRLFFVFRDRTAGKTTYGAGRFLYADLPKDGYVTLDFNKAYNPPCAFTPYSTCPIPPPENRLPFPIEAGEQMYEDH